MHRVSCLECGNSHAALLEQFFCQFLSCIDMRTIQSNIALSDMSILILLAVARLALHLFTNSQYGFHRDELAVLDDARHLAWGYINYPPMTPFIGRMALELFGTSLVSIRFFSALALSIVMVLTGLMSRELGGTIRAQVVASLAAAIAPMSLIMGAMFQYTAFDYLWWVLIAYLILRLLKSNDPRWWLGISAVVGLGLLTKYTMAVYVVGIIAGVLFTSSRRYLKSPWFWGGVVLSVLIILPNFIWQIQHHFIVLTFLSHIHVRDVQLGRADGFLPMQLLINANPFILPLWVTGLYYYFRSSAGVRYRMLGWMYLMPLVLLMIMQGRFYYLAPAYPMLIAAGAVVGERWLFSTTTNNARLGWRATWTALMAGSMLGSALMLPIAPINSALWKVTSQIHDNFVEQIGWSELVTTVANTYTALPNPEKPLSGILTGNYGEAGAINLYGPESGLPEAISGVNSYWLRGYGDPSPQVLIVVGFSYDEAEHFFTTCSLAGRITNRYGVMNEESQHPDIFVCRNPRQPWPELWQDLQSFG
jgi:4-amino-4-deoxy-L-arabinose transferase-like glycosyltransferase